MKIVSINIGGRTFNVNCPDGQEEALAQATEQIDMRFREIAQNAPNLPFDQILVLAALNGFVSYQQKINQHQQNEQSTHKRLKRLAELFDNMKYADEF